MAEVNCAVRKRSGRSSFEPDMCWTSRQSLDERMDATVRVLCRFPVAWEIQLQKSLIAYPTGRLLRHREHIESGPLCTVAEALLGGRLTGPDLVNVFLRER